MSLEFLRALPKVELHCHLLGTVRAATFIDLARKAGAPIPREDIEAFYVRGEKPVGVLKALRTLDQLIREPDDLYRMTREYLEDAAAHTVRYAEFFWNPTAPRVCRALRTRMRRRPSCVPSTMRRASPGA